jgi:hypothetical protein
MKVANLSALRTGGLYRPGNISGTHFCYRLSQPLGHSTAGRIMTQSRIESATFRLVAQCLNQMRHRVPQDYCQTQLYLLCKNILLQISLMIGLLGRNMSVTVIQ